MVIVLAIGLRVPGFQPGRGRWICKDNKNPYHEGTLSRLPLVARFYGTLKIPAEYEREISLAKVTTIPRKVSSDSLLDVFAGYCHRDLVDELEIIRTEMGKHSKSEMVAVYGTLYAIPPRKL
jgi:hypothetical protein